MSKEKDILSEILGFDPEGEDRVDSSEHPDDANLKVIPRDGNPIPLYKSWDDLTSLDSPWGRYLEEPFVLAIPETRGKPLERAKKISQIVQSRETNRGYVKDSHELHVEEPPSLLSPLDPEIPVLITAEEGRQKISLPLGGIVEAIKPGINDVFKLANNSPWGPEGGYQTLANITGKPVNIRTGEASTRYLPVSKGEAA